MTAKTALARNLRSLMDREDLSEALAAKKTGVSQKGINKILNENTSAGIDTIERLAKAFRIPVWLLITPNMDISESTLLENYRAAPEPAKAMIKSVAEAAAPYSTDNNQAVNE